MLENKKLMAVIVVLAVIIIVSGGVIAEKMIQTAPTLNVPQNITEPSVNISHQNNASKVNNSAKQELQKPAQRNTVKEQSVVDVNVSPYEAKAVAQSVIEEPGCYAGSPKLVHEEGGYTYYVPVLSNGTLVGEIFVDAQTGKCIGGTA